MSIIVIVAAAAVATSIPLAVWAASSSRSAGRAVNTAALGGGTATVDLRRITLAQSGSARLGPVMGGIGGLARQLTPAAMVRALERRIAQAGSPNGWSLEHVLLAKLGLTAAVGLVAVTALTNGPSPLEAVAWVALVVLAYLLPDVLLHRRAAARQTTIDASLPDTLDQMTISVEAGLGFDAAMARAARSGHGPLADELLRTMQEIQIGVPRAKAMRSLADRVEAPNMRHFVTAVIQAEQYGIPLGEILRTQADEQRTRRRQRAEEQATKLPVKLVFPLVLCILPALFVVILGPAVVQISRMFLHTP
jgi:tight adherence protein C